ncbi:elongation factor P 5-aminopentanone reductase [Cytobacillus sp. FJAT-54145]|uniref:Elongation factor P 5-aminopentanone reductase n=1 Tax=Cytobacillus spartinae TaxID=3299023 RepID=A0ABW6K4P4_9BACI
MNRKFALITGASGGIGSAIAYKLAEEGYSLYLHYHQNENSMSNLIKTLNRFRGEYIPIQADLTTTDGYKKIASNIFSLDAIVHNSGTSHYGLLMDLDDHTLNDLMRVHVTTPLLLTKELLPKLLAKQHGSIVVISSIWGQVGAACEVAYSTAKGAQISFVKALSKEVALNGIRVNGVAPGAIHTRMLEGFTEAELQSVTEEIPMGKLGSPNDIGDAVAFLLSERSSYITGQVLSVNGGWYV